MKIRLGFVSNSSSQSFVIYGVLVKKEELRNLLGIEINGEDSKYEAFDRIWSALDKKTVSGYLTLKDTRDYFGGDETDDCVIGHKWGEMNDGCIEQIDDMSEYEKQKTLDDLKALGLNVDKISIFAGYISNDNY